MGVTLFMQSCIKFIIQSIKNAKIYLILSSTLFLFGILFGALFNTNLEGVLFYDIVVNNYVIIFDKEISLLGYCFSKFFAYFGIGIIVFASSLTIFLFPLNGIIFFYQGFLLSTLVPYFYCAFSVIGIIVYIITVLPCIILRFCSFSLLSSINYSARCECNKCKKSLYLSAIFIFITFSIITLFWELITIGIIIRPLNFYL